MSEQAQPPITSSVDVSTIQDNKLKVVSLSATSNEFLPFFEAKAPDGSIVVHLGMQNLLGGSQADINILNRRSGVKNRFLIDFVRNLSAAFVSPNGRFVIVQYSVTNWGNDFAVFQQGPDGGFSFVPGSHAEKAGKFLVANGVSPTSEYSRLSVDTISVSEVPDTVHAILRGSYIQHSAQSTQPISFANVAAKWVMDQGWLLESDTTPTTTPRQNAAAVTPRPGETRLERLRTRQAAEAAAHSLPVPNAYPATSAAICTYRARISAKDHFTSKGQDLRTMPNIKAADFLLQDRMNFHKYTGGDQGDEEDGVFNRLGADAFRQLFEDKPVIVSPENFDDHILFNQTPLVEVTVRSDALYVNVIEQGSRVAGSPQQTARIPSTAPFPVHPIPVPQVTPVVPKAVPSAGVARVYDGRGHVYSIPELQGLAGRRLTHAWLYGDLSLKSWQGNTARFVTANITGLVGEGSTVVEATFDKGVFISPQTRQDLAQGYLKTIAKVYKSNPLELLSVQRTADGHLFVTARGAVSLNL